MFSFKRVLAVAKREYLQLRRNSLYMVMAFLCPLILFLPFSYGLKLDVDEIKLGVCDMDNSPLSRELIQEFPNSSYFILEKYTNSYDLMEQDMKQGKIGIVMVIPKDFSKKLRNFENTNVQFCIDASIPERANTIEGYAEGIVSVFNQKLQNEFVNYKGNDMKKASIQIYNKVWFNDSLDSQNYVIPPLIAVILYFFPPLLSALTVVKEKETGSFMAFLCSPATKAEYIIGKMIPYSLITFCNFTALYFLVRILFPDIPFRGSLPFLFLTAIFYCISTTGVGLILSVLMTSQVAAVMICFVGTMIPAFNYSGMFTSLNSMTRETLMMAKSMPVTYFITIIRDVFLKYGSTEFIVKDGLMLVLFSVLFPIIAIFFLKKRL